MSYSDTLAKLVVVLQKLYLKTDLITWNQIIVEVVNDASYTNCHHKYHAK